MPDSVQSNAEHRHHGGSVNSERLSFPLRLLIQVVTLFVMGAAFIVRIEGRIDSLNEKIQELTQRVKERDLKADAIHSTQGADLSNHNIRLNRLEWEVDVKNGRARPSTYEDR